VIEFVRAPRKNHARWSAEDVIRRSLRFGSGMNEELSIVAKLFSNRQENIM
jgi:hypothetical protein